MLEGRGLSVRYGAVSALDGVGIRVRKGELVAILGANGAGKTTLLRAISGLAKPFAGSVWQDGRDITAMPAEKRVRHGIAHVPEGRGMFHDLTVRENLLVGAYVRGDRRQIAQDCGAVLQTFPSLARRERQDSSTLSGGEQQMLAIGRALMARPQVLLADEVSLGLAPVITKQVFAELVKLRERGITLVVVEQNANLVLRIADYVYVLQHGRVVLEGAPADIAAAGGLAQAYLGA
ncbi:ABC transporter ATP-binding protein [Variovorax paradoxus]|nr:ABC transporter ATP-binding protein [Variovorax paradoxus]KPV03403.1 ABC transporter ATP-binding protein [Variovorax paradoxus]KPV04686.1 ABC transporter ATP-binding protein [Variovorax paradoxus]KPV19196.1 ABC transporter ATP-binding protein [Variovorax paradoxus]KPV30208.1 ABC transporter ATP-binding protein [Variovorax paradoxus]